MAYLFNKNIMLTEVNIIPHIYSYHILSDMIFYGYNDKCLTFDLISWNN